MTSNLIDFNSFSCQNENTCSYYTIQEFLSNFSNGNNNDICGINSNSGNNNTEIHGTYNNNENDIDIDKENENFSILHINSRSISKNFESLITLLHSLSNFTFSVIGISETWLNKNSPDIFDICDYKMIHVDRNDGRGGGVALYIHKNFKYKVRNDISFPGIESIFVEIENKTGKNILIGTLYRPPTYTLNEFIDNLDEILHNISKESKDCYLLGDYNIDLAHCLQPINLDFLNQNNNTNSADDNHNNLHTISNSPSDNSYNHQHKNKFLNLMYSYAFHPCINIPTRLTATSATLIDNIFTNVLSKSNSGILYHDVSDHLPIFTITSRSISKARIKPIENSFRKESTENVKALIDDLLKESWQEVYNEKDINNAYEKFIDSLTYYYNKNIPLIKQRKHKNKIKNPWITQGIFNSIQTRNKLYKSYLRNPTEENGHNYKRYRNLLSNLIRISKKLHYAKELDSVKGDSKLTWRIINDVINKKKDHIKAETINVNGIEITSPKEISNEFNSYFVNIGPKLGSQINCNEKHFSEYLPNPSNSAIFLSPTNEAEIIKIVKSFASKPSAGYDGISTKLLKKISFRLHLL